MAHKIFSGDWASAFSDQLNASEEYRKSAATWEWPMIFRVTKDPSVGLNEDKGIYLDLWHGQCREAREATAADLESVPYVISADLFTWKQVMEKKLDPLGGLMRGKLKLTRGNMIKLAGYVSAAKNLVDAATRVDTAFPEGL